MVPPRRHIVEYQAPDTEVRPAVDAAQAAQETLVSQCNHVISRGRRRGQRCRHTTQTDYRRCEEHLVADWHVVVAPSRIEGAGLGLYAVNPSLVSRRYLKLPPRSRSPPAPCRLSEPALFCKDDRIGCFAGEIISSDDYDVRFRDSHYFAPYVLGISTESSHDETFARTALSYANDGVNITDPLLRRNYIYRTATHVVWHDTTWPHVVNCYCDNSDATAENRACLLALGDIRHGDELLLSYSGSNCPSKDAEGRWLREYPYTVDAPIQDSYFYGLLEVAPAAAAAASASSSLVLQAVSSASASAISHATTAAGRITKSSYKASGAS